MKTVIKMKLFGGYVLQHRFNYYPGIVKPTDQEMTAIEKSLLFTFPKEKGYPCMHAGPHGGNPRVSLEAEGARGKHGRESLLCFPWERQSKAG